MIKDGLIFFVVYVVVVQGIRFFVYQEDFSAGDLLQTAIAGLVAAGIMLYLKRKSAQ